MVPSQGWVKLQIRHHLYQGITSSVGGMVHSVHHPFPKVFFDNLGWVGWAVHYFAPIFDRQSLKDGGPGSCASTRQAARPPPRRHRRRQPHQRRPRGPALPRGVLQRHRIRHLCPHRILLRCSHPLFISPLDGQKLQADAPICFLWFYFSCCGFYHTRKNNLNCPIVNLCCQTGATCFPPRIFPKLKLFQIFKKNLKFYF
jgi:hypothetical protein